MPQKKTRLPGKGTPAVRPSSWSEKLRSRWLVCLLLGLVMTALFLPAIQFDFVDYDDSDYVKANPHVLTGLSWKNIAWAFQTGHASNWHPLTWLSHMLDCSVFGTGPHGPHLVNVLLHGTNAILLFLVLGQLTAAFWRSAMVAALFALHPLHVESVAWISERKDVLSAMFFVLTLSAYSVYVQRYLSRASSPEARPKAESSNPVVRPIGPSPTIQDTHRTDRKARPVLWYFLALTLFALGLMSKPMLVTLPFVLLLLDYWPLQRVQWENSESCRKEVRFLILEKIPFLVLSVISSAVTFLV
jgi:hypothetical protein